MMKLVDENWFKFKKSFKVELGIVLQDKVGFLLQFLNARERKIRGIYLQLTEKKSTRPAQNVRGQWWQHRLSIKVVA